MLETSIETIESKKPLSLVDQARDINKDTILNYTKTYLQSHAYISSKKISIEYVYEYYNLTHTSMDYDKIKRILYSKFTPAILSLRRERLITRYNNSSLYKRVDPIIAKSLSTNISKTDPETKNCTGTVKLIYYQGRFVNPKFYDI